MGRTAGVEPAMPPWQGGALPLRHAREPSPRIELGASFVPGTRSNRWSYEGIVLAGLDSNQRRSGVQGAVAPAIRATGQSPFPVPTWAACLHKRLADAGPKGIACARPDLNRDRLAALASRASVSARFHHEREPPPGVEPGLPPYEGGAASRARRQSWPSRPRTRKLRVQSAAGLPNSPNGH